MKKSLISLLSLISVATLVGCGSSSVEPTTTNSTTTSTGPTTEPSTESTSTTIEAQEHVVTFMADGEVIGTATYKDGDTSVTEPEIPEKEGYVGEYEEYELNGTDITVNVIYTLKDVKVKNGSFSYSDGKYISNVTNSLAVDKNIEFNNGTLSVTLHKGQGYEDSGIIFGVTYSGDELENFWESEGVSYYFFFINNANFAYLAKSQDGVWSQLTGLGAITEYNEESDFPLSVSVTGNYVDCYVGDKCLCRAYDKDLETSSGVVGYRAGGANTTFTPLQASTTPTTNTLDTDDFSVAHGSIEETTDGIKVTSNNTIALAKNNVSTAGKLISVDVKPSTTQDVGIVFGLNGGYRSFWEESYTQFEYYFFLLNFNGTAIIAHVNSTSDVDVWKTLTDSSTIKDYSPTKTYNLGVYVEGKRISCFIDGAYVGGYTTMTDIGDDGYGVRAATSGCEFSNMSVKDFDNTNPHWFLRAGSMKVTTDDSGAQTITTSCDGTLATIENYTFEGKGGTVSMDMKFEGGPRNGGLIFGGASDNLIWGTNYYIFETDWANNAWIADGTADWLPVLGRPLSEILDAWGNDVAAGWNDFHNYKIVWDGAGIATAYINNIEVLKMNVSNPTHTGNYFGFFSQGAGVTTIKNLQVTVNK